MVTLLITLLITTHEPPSRSSLHGSRTLGLLQGKGRAPGKRLWGSALRVERMSFLWS